MTKTVSVSDDAYEALVAVKRRGESFSELALRLVGPLRQDILFDRTRPPVFTEDEARRLLELTYRARDESRKPRVRFP